MNRITKVLLAASIVSAAIFSGCSPKVYTTRYTKTPEIRLAQKVQSSQKLGDITIELKPIDDKEMEKEFYKQKFKIVKYDAVYKTYSTEVEEFIIPFYNKLSPFSVTITNNTDHVLRMRDSRIIYIDPDSDEPVFALDKQSIMEDIKTQIPTYNSTLSYLTNIYRYTKLENLEVQLKDAIIDITNHIKFINGFNKEIMPNMRVSGIIMFPVDPEKVSEGKISFIDMTSKTDAAGNPSQKVRFDYRINLFYRYWKIDPNTFNLVEVNQDEYNKGLINPEKYYYDKAQKIWVSGSTLEK